MFKLIAIDGPDLSGKSTLINTIISKNPEKFDTIKILDESRPMAKFIREYLQKPLTDDSYAIFKHLFLANAHEIHSEILEKLNYKNVILDRHIISTMIYGINHKVHEFAFFNEVKMVYDQYPFKSDYNLYIDIDENVFESRKGERKDKAEESYESLDEFITLQYMARRVFNAIMKDAAQMNISVLDGSVSKEDLYYSAMKIINDVEKVGHTAYYKDIKRKQYNKIISRPDFKKEYSEEDKFNNTINIIRRKQEERMQTKRRRE